MSILRCPVCNKKVDTEVAKATPFCSERCRLVDLGRWLGEEYGLPYEGDEEPESPAGGQQPDTR